MPEASSTRTWNFLTGVAFFYFFIFLFCVDWPVVMKPFRELLNDFQEILSYCYSVNRVFL